MSSPLPKVKVDTLPNARLSPASQDSIPRLWGIPLKYISLVTLAVQNASLTIIMHYSRISTSPSQTYSAASAVLLNELLKGTISLIIAFSRIEDSTYNQIHTLSRRDQQVPSWIQPSVFLSRCKKLWGEILSPDCWKLSIPAILYVIQNNLQFVAASNLEAATFQVSYQMKILTTAAFSVALLRKRLNTTKWTALMGLALGVGIVQIQSGSSKSSDDSAHGMHPFTGFMAVVAACFTSGLAGVYFEMVLKGSQADLWVRNVQLSLFSLIPALVPVFADSSSSSGSIFANFGGWAWATVLTQVAGGLITAVVIKYSDNILKGFATSLSIVLASVASIALFDFQVTPSFIAGSSTVLAATWLYNQPDGADLPKLPKIVAGVVTPRRGSIPGTPMEPVDADEPILGEPDEKRRTGISPGVLSSALKLVTPRSSLENLSSHNNNDSLAPASPVIGSRTSSSASLADYQLRYTASSSSTRSHSPAPVATTTTSAVQQVGGGGKFHSASSKSGSLTIPPVQFTSHSYGKDDSAFAVVNLNESPGRPIR